MTPGLDQALARWESGALSREELVLRFPGDDVEGLLDTVERMRAMADVATPNAMDAWEVVRDRLPVRLDDRRRGGARAIRLLAAAMIAVLLMGATAYALVPSVRRAVDDAVHVFIGDADPPLRQTDPASDADEPPANTPGEQPAPSPGTGEAPGDDETGQDANGDSDPGSGNDGTNGDGAGSGSNDGETGGEQGSSGDEGSAEGGSGTGSEADGEDHGSSGDEGASMDSGMGSGE